MPDDVIEEFVGDDDQFAHHLRERLTALRDQTDDPSLAHALERVLRGEMSVRELAALPAMGDVIERGVHAFVAEWKRLDQGEREAAVRDGEARIHD